MNGKTSGAVYQLVETPSAKTEICTEFSTVYSALALYPNGDFYKSDFVYDISRTKERAKNIIDKLTECKPTENELIDFIAELI